MKLPAAVILLAFVLSAAAPAFAGEREAGRSFEMIAEVETPQGDRRLGLTIDVQRFSRPEEAQQLRETLASGGQHALVAALRQRSDGKLRLGSFELPLGLVLAQALDDDAYRYIVVTARRIRHQEAQQGGESLEYPFGVAVFEVNRRGSGEGQLYHAAALSIDADGQVSVEQYEVDPGRLMQIKQLR